LYWDNYLLRPIVNGCAYLPWKNQLRAHCKGAKAMSDTDNDRRQFLKVTLMSAGAAVMALGSSAIAAGEGIKVGKLAMKIAVTDAAAGGECSHASGCAGGSGKCSYGSDCAGGGGKCSYGSDCGGSGDGGGGGGKCSYGSDCAGGGGKCSYGSDCAGGGGKCSYGSDCAGGGGKCSYGSNCGGS
jgi:hypothetical protein